MIKKWTTFLAVITICCVGWIVYSNSLHVPFSLDDDYSISGNANIRTIFNLHDVWDFWPARFVTYFSFSLNYYFNGLNVYGYHFFNLVVHLISAILVWWLVLLTFSTPVIKEEKISRHAYVISLLSGLIFVAHPIQTEAVTYIVQRAASMAAMFYLASLCLYINSRLHEAKGSNPDLVKDNHIGSLIMAILAIFTKETAITLPLMIILYEACFFQPEAGQPLAERVQKVINWKRVLPFFLIILIIPLTEGRPERLQRLCGETGISPGHYFLTQLRVMVTYLRLVFIPFNQNLDYDYPVFRNLLDIPVLGSLFFLCAVLWLGKHLFLKYRLLAFSIFWFFLTLLPESSFFPIRDVIFEHRLYLPLAGFSIFSVSSIYYLLGQNSIKIMVAVLIGVVICYSVLTYERNRIWGNTISLWDDTVEKSPHKSRPFNNRGLGLLKQGRIDQALVDFNQAIALEPDNAGAYVNRGLVFEKKGKALKALIEYSKASMIDSKFWMSYHNRALIYQRLGDYPRAIADATKVIEIKPNDPGPYLVRGVIFAQEGNYLGLIADFKKSIELDPYDPEAHLDIGVALARQGQLIQAITEFNNALELDPNFKEAENDRALAYTLLMRKRGDRGRIQL